MTDLESLAQEMKHEAPDAVPVTVIGERDLAPEHGAFQNYQFMGTEPPVRILPLAATRNRAVIVCMSGFVNNNIVGNVYVGSFRQVSNFQGGVFVSGMSMVYEAQ